MTYTTVTYCGNDHTDWLSSIDFYKNEFDILEKRLVEVAGKNNGSEPMAWVEHFQNQFLIQRNNMAELRHSIHDHTGKVSSDAKLHAGKMETGLAGEHDDMKERFAHFEKIVKDLRAEFNQFLSKWM